MKKREFKKRVGLTHPWSEFDFSKHDPLPKDAPEVRAEKDRLIAEWYERKGRRITQINQCSRCSKDAQPNQRYCLECKAAYMREWRKTHPLNGDQKKKDICRSYSSVLLKRGVIKRQPCHFCNSDISEMHHADYDNPREVEWLCRPCHLMLHDIARETGHAAI